MERRALLAVILMFFVLILYNMFLASKRSVPRAPKVGQQEEVVERPETTLVEPVTIGEPTEEAPPRQVVVTTPHYTAGFSSVGGVLTTYKLNRYLSGDEEPVELVPDSDRLPLAMALLTKAGDRIDLSQAGFSVSSESLAIEDTSRVSLGFRLTTEGGLIVSKVCTFQGESYVMDVEIEVSGPGSDMVRAVEFGWQSGLRVTETHRRNDDLGNFASITLTGEGPVKKSLRDVKKREEIAIGGDIRWSGVKTKYFFAALVPVDAGEVVVRSFPTGEEAIGLVLEADRAQVRAQRFIVYVGPLDYEGLRGLGFGLERAVDFGWKWIQPLSKLVFRFLLFCHRAIPNYGLVIILLSALTKLLFYPLTQKSFKSMREMQRLQPEVEALREKYKKDPQRLNKAMMDLYKERGVNPLGGCFPLLLQMPVFISLFNVLSKTIELRRASFVFWIKDLSAPDVVAHLPFTLPFVGNAVSVLPILMGIAMFLQQKMSSTDPKHAAMTYMLPIVFTVMFFRFPSGLVLYWLVNNVLTIGHQYLMARAERTQEALTTGG